MKDSLLAKMELIETKIKVYSELGDSQRVKELDLELKPLKMHLLDIMTFENELDLNCIAFEAFLDNLTEAA